MSRDRKEVYVRRALRRVLTGRRESLTTVVNLIADRYQGILDREGPQPGTTVRMDDVYRALGREYRRPLEAADIAAFPARLRDWCARHPEEPDEAHHAATLAYVEKARFVKLVALVD